MRNKVLSIITSVAPHPNIPINPGFSTPSSKNDYKSSTHFMSTPTNKPTKIQLPVNSTKKLLFLDLDETLVHSTFQKIPDADYIVPVELEGSIFHVYVKRRPGALEFIEKMSRFYDIAIFTASMPKYADPLINMMDIKNYITGRYFREHCVSFENIYVKDLSRFGKDLRNVILIDNSPTAYMFQPENAIPITTWIDDTADCEFLKLEPIMELLSHVYDVRPYIRKLVVNDSINHKKAEAYLKNELSITISKSKPIITESSQKPRLFTGTRNSVNSKSKVESIYSDQNAPCLQPIKDGFFSANGTFTKNYIKISSEKSRKCQISPYVGKSQVVPATAKASSIREKSESLNAKERKQHIAGKILTDVNKGIAQMSQFTAPNYTNLLNARKEIENEKKSYCIDTKKWLEYYESIRNELDKCVSTIGTQKKVGQIVNMKEAENKGKLKNNEELLNRKEKPINRINGKATYSKAYVL